MRTDELVTWFLAARDAPPATALQKVDLLLLDFIGNAVSGGTSELGVAIRRHIAETAADGRAQVLGDPETFAPGAAALANATLASAFDFDEGYHVGAYTVASSLAAAQTAGVSGDLFRRTIAAGYEAGETLRKAADAERDSGGGITNHGWYHVGIVGPLVAALCAGSLLGLDDDRLANAVSIATGSSGGIRAHFGKGAKQLTPGVASRGGVEAAQLARLGVTGTFDALSGELGLDTAVAWGAHWDWARFGAWSWDKGAFSKPLTLRRYPAVAPGQPALDAMIRLKAEHGFAVEDVVRIEAKNRPFSLRTPAAADEGELGFSLPYLLAVTAADGAFGIPQLRWERAIRDDVRRLMALVEDKTDGVDSVVVHLADGSRFEAQEQEINYLTSDAEAFEKFHRALTEAGADGEDDVRAWIDGLPTLATVGAVPVIRK